MTNVKEFALLKLFKGYHIIDNNDAEEYKNNIELSASKGLMYDSRFPITTMGLQIAIELYGKDGEKWNQTFHKSFKTVKDTPIETLVAQQIIHYFTTYGLENLGLYNEDLVYIPHEQLDVPELEEDIPVIMLHYMTYDMIAEKLMTLLTSGIALSQETLDLVKALSDYIPKDRFDEIKNKEFKIYLYDKYNIVPNNPKEFLRYIIYKLTGETLIVNNRRLRKLIQASDKDETLRLLNIYLEHNTIEKLSSIFFNYRKLFIAMKVKENQAISSDKARKELNHIINVIGGNKADKYHKEQDTGILSKLSKIQSMAVFNLFRKDIESELKTITPYHIVRLINMLSFNIQRYNGYVDNDVLYRVRTGAAYVKHRDNCNDLYAAQTQEAIKSLCEQELIRRFKSKFEDKVVYIPENINYTLPKSEKMFVDNIPSGSYIEIERQSNLVLGIHWNNLSNERVDLDLHTSNKSQHFGWNGSYRRDDLYFTGDVTDAPLPNGATELFYIGNNLEDQSFILTLNNYTNNREDVPFEFVIAKVGNNHIDKNYVINPNNIVATVPLKVKNTKPQMTLGLIKIMDNRIRFYFDTFDIGNSIAMSDRQYITKAYTYLDNSLNTQYNLKTFLQKCRAFITHTKSEKQIVKFEKLEDGTLEQITDERASELINHGNGHLVFTQETEVDKPVDIDLSLENITKDTFIDLLQEDNK